MMSKTLHFTVQDRAIDLNVRQQHGEFIDIQLTLPLTFKKLLFI